MHRLPDSEEGKAKTKLRTNVFNLFFWKISLANREEYTMKTTEIFNYQSKI